MKIVDIPETGPLLSSEADAVEIIGTLYGVEADYVAIPVRRMVPGFWDLKTRLAGLFIQKLIQYGQHPAFVGDLSSQMAGSAALRDYVRECNRRRDVLFAPNRAELEAML